MAILKAEVINAPILQGGSSGGSKDFMDYLSGVAYLGQVATTLGSTIKSNQDKDRDFKIAGYKAQAEQMLANSGSYGELFVSNSAFRDNDIKRRRLELGMPEEDTQEELLKFERLLMTNQQDELKKRGLRNSEDVYREILGDLYVAPDAENADKNVTRMLLNDLTKNVGQIQNTAEQSAIQEALQSLVASSSVKGAANRAYGATDVSSSEMTDIQKRDDSIRAHLKQPNLTHEQIVQLLQEEANKNNPDVATPPLPGINTGSQPAAEGVPVSTANPTSAPATPTPAATPAAKPSPISSAAPALVSAAVGAESVLGAQVGRPNPLATNASTFIPINQGVHPAFQAIREDTANADKYDKAKPKAYAQFADIIRSSYSADPQVAEILGKVKLTEYGRDGKTPIDLAAPANQALVQEAAAAMRKLSPSSSNKSDVELAKYFLSLRSAVAHTATSEFVANGVPIGTALKTLYAPNSGGAIGLPVIGAKEGGETATVSTDLDKPATTTIPGTPLNDLYNKNYAIESSTAVGTNAGDLVAAQTWLTNNPMPPIGKGLNLNADQLAMQDWRDRKAQNEAQLKLNTDGLHRVVKRAYQVTRNSNLEAIPVSDAELIKVKRALDGIDTTMADVMADPSLRTNANITRLFEAQGKLSTQQMAQVQPILNDLQQTANSARSAGVELMNLNLREREYGNLLERQRIEDGLKNRELALREKADSSSENKDLLKNYLTLAEERRKQLGVMQDMLKQVNGNTHLFRQWAEGTGDYAASGGGRSTVSTFQKLDQILNPTLKGNKNLYDALSLMVAVGANPTAVSQSPAATPEGVAQTQPPVYTNTAKAQGAYDRYIAAP